MSVQEGFKCAHLPVVLNFISNDVGIICFHSFSIGLLVLEVVFNLDAIS